MIDKLSPFIGRGIRPIPVLPTVYTDALSYGEQVGKMIHKIDETVDKVNEVVDDNNTFKTNVESEINTFEQSVADDINTFETSMTTWKNGVDSDLSSWKASTKNELDTNYAQFLADYQREWGVTQTTGNSETDVMSQKAVTDLFNGYVKKEITSLNKFNKNNVETGYVDYSSGELVVNVSYYASDYMPVESGEAYKILNTGNAQGAYYDSSKEYVDGFVTANDFNLQAIPDGVTYVRFTIPVANIDTAGFYVNEEYNKLLTWLDTTEYVEEVVADKLKSTVIECTRTVSTRAQLIQAINDIWITDGYHYTIYLEAGTYVLDWTAIQTLINYEKGMELPNNVDLIGLGNVIIKTDLTGESSSVQTNVSTLNVKWNNVVKNITFIANNCRYAVHDDNSNVMENYNQIFEDCTFIHEGVSDDNWSYPAGFGEGVSSGASVTFKNCTFVSPLRSYYLHNQIGQNYPSHHTFENCTFLGVNDGDCVQIDSQGSGVNDVATFIGCKFNGILRCKVIAGSGITNNEFTINGTGNTPVGELFYFTDGNYYKTEFGDENNHYFNKSGSTISYGTAVKLVNGYIVPMSNDDNASCFAGITVDEITNNNHGLVKYKGYIRITGTLASQSEGTLITVTNGQLAVCGNNDYPIGKIAYKNTTDNRTYALLF